MFGGKITLTVLTCHSLLKSAVVIVDDDMDEGEISVVDPVFVADDDNDEDESEADAESDAADADEAETGAAADADEG